MALTNETSRKVSENLVTPNDNIRLNGRTLSPEAAILFDKSIVARPLMTPEVCSIQVKTGHEFYYRWVNRASLNGQLYMQRRAMGFVNATTEDVDVLAGDAQADKGEVRAGDLILMKLPYHLYAAHMKSNMLRAQVLGNMRGTYLKGKDGDNQGVTDLWSDDKPKRATVSDEPFARQTQMKPFIPDNPDAILDHQSESVIAKAKEQVAEIRERIDSERDSKKSK